MKFYLLFCVNSLYSKVVFHFIRVNLSRVNFQYLKFNGALISYNNVNHYYFITKRQDEPRKGYF